VSVDRSHQGGRVRIIVAGSRVVHGQRLNRPISLRIPLRSIRVEAKRLVGAPGRPAQVAATRQVSRSGTRYLRVTQRAERHRFGARWQPHLESRRCTKRYQGCVVGRGTPVVTQAARTTRTDRLPRAEPTCPVGVPDVAGSAAGRPTHTEVVNRETGIYDTVPHRGCQCARDRLGCCRCAASSHHGCGDPAADQSEECSPAGAAPLFRWLIAAPVCLSLHHVPLSEMRRPLGRPNEVYVGALGF
jgi:hypothetical protein